MASFLSALPNPLAYAMEWDLSSRKPALDANSRELLSGRVLPYNYKAYAFNASTTLGVLAAVNAFALGLLPCLVYGMGAALLRFYSENEINQTAKPALAEGHNRQESSLFGRVARAIRPEKDPGAMVNICTNLRIKDIVGWEPFVEVWGQRVFARAIPEHLAENR